MPEQATKSWRELLHPVFAVYLSDEQMGKRDLSTPHHLGDHIYATDSKVAVRVPATPELIEAVRGLNSAPPPTDTLPWTDLYSTVPLKIGPIPPPRDKVECSVCRGAKTLSEITCRECEGDGHVSCEYHYQHECPRCTGSGRTRHEGPCYRCCGNGWIIPGPRRLLAWGNGIHLLLERARPLIDAGAVFYTSTKPVISPWRFVIAPNVEGLIMPRRPEEGDELIQMPEVEG